MQLERLGDGRYINGVRQPREIDMIYAVHKQTKEHQVVGPHSAILMRDYDIVPADADGWVKWYGDKECPLPSGSQHEARIGTRHTYTRGQHPEHLIWREVRAYRPILNDEPKAPKWNGEGLPPVGLYVDVVDDGTLYYGRGESGEVIAHVEDCAIIRMSYGLGAFKANVLRRDTRDERERWLDAAIYAYINKPDASSVAEAIYDALKSGELPHP